MTDQRLTTMTAAELAPLLRTRRLSPVELTQAHLDQISALDGNLNSYMVVMAEQALAAARAAEAAIARGGWLGPLHGIPLGIKDLYDVAGVPNTFGSKVLRDNVPQRDATVIQRLKAAGAIILGKQGMHEFAFGVTSENPHFGAIRNPWDLSRIPGGSSGGTAAAIAAGLCVAGLGSDTGGSIRIPAALCGIAGIKPTYGRVSRHGVLPLAWSLDHAGPLARSAADLAIMLQAIAGPDPLDPSTPEIPVPDFTRDLGRGVRGLRLGVPKDHYWDVIEPGVAGAVRSAIETLSGLGAELVEVSLPSSGFAQAALIPIISAEGAAWHEPWLKERPQDYGDDVRLRLQGGAITLATAYLKGQRIRTAIQMEFAAALAEVDAIVTPTVTVVAPKIGETMQPSATLGVVPRGVINRNTCPGNLAGLPAATVPCGLVDGLPVGLQVMGAAWQEALILRIARAYELGRGPLPAPRRPEEA